MATKQSIRNEIIRCGQDPNYFIKKYVKIVHPVRGLIPFSMFDYQEELVRNYIGNRFNIILKARQLGISEVTAAYAAWMMLFRRDKKILVMATKAETAKNIISKVETALKRLPQWLMLAEITTDNKLSIELSNGSKIKAITTSDDAGRSEALSLLIIDEAAFVKNLDDLWTGLFPTVSAGGRIIVLSTPNGVGNKFHSLYVDAEKNLNDFCSTKLMWWLHPERIKGLEDDVNRPGFKTSDWYRHEIKSLNMSPRDIAQELECNFNASGDTVLSGDVLEWIRSQNLHPNFKENWDRNLFIWSKPQPKHRYLLSADVARGDASDNSAFHVFDLECMEQVAEYEGKLPPKEFAEVLCRVGREYNTALMVIENNNVGLACIEHVRLAFYEALYYSRKGDHRPGEVVNTNFGPYENDTIPGFTTSPRTRPLIISKMEEYIRDRGLMMKSFRLTEELKTFIWSNGRAEAMRGSNDDLVMSLAIGIWIRDTFIAPGAHGADADARMIDGISTFKTDNTQIIGASKDPRFINQKSMGTFQQEKDKLQMRLPNGQVADFTWLYDGISRG